MIFLYSSIRAILFPGALYVMMYSVMVVKQTIQILVTDNYIGNYFFSCGVARLSVTVGP